MSVTVKTGNILDATEPFVFHQCNVMSKSARGVAKALFERFPEANTYQPSSQVRRIFGTASFHQTGPRTPTIINAYAQRTPGKYKTAAELKERRATLEAILYTLPPAVHTVAVPWRIGCGLAGGSWPDHLAMLKEFATTRNVHVVIYKLESEP